MAASNESDNCYFAFRWIICLFKREFMKAKTDGYQDCLLVWETVWSANSLQALSEKPVVTEEVEVNGRKSSPESQNDDGGGMETPEGTDASERLSDVQLFILCLCLSIIRRERDLIMAHQYDACDILKHFNTLQLNEDLNGILLHASTIWFWVKNDGGEGLLYSEGQSGTKSTETTVEDFDLLNDDFQVISHLNV